MPNIHTHNFGPGRYESMRLDTWVSKVEAEGKLKRFDARLTGTFTVYCGNGWEHDTEIAEKVSLWNTPHDPEGLLLAALHEDAEGNTDLKYTVADSIMEFALEDYEDPCEEEFIDED